VPLKDNDENQNTTKSKTKDRVRGHHFDGIEEYDNSLPNWWLLTFFLTIVFAFVYWYHYHVLGKGLTQQQELEADLAAQQQLVAAKQTGVVLSDEAIQAMVKDAVVLAQGHQTFNSYCVACHGAGAEGNIGPNLTDNYWIHGSKPTMMVKTVTEGVPSMGMTPWKGVLSATQINSVVAYVISLRGSSPPKAKAPQGNLEP
jgi:cytochrome c oxidase cbb3-type subunit 3